MVQSPGFGQGGMKKEIDIQRNLLEGKENGEWKGFHSNNKIKYEGV